MNNKNNNTTNVCGNKNDNKIYNKGNHKFIFDNNDNDNNSNNNNQ